MSERPFSDPPKRNDRYLPIARVPLGVGLRAVVASYRAVGVWTHWDEQHRRKVLCEGDGCPWCTSSARPPLWYGYFLIQREDGSLLSLCECTAPVVEELEAARDEYGENAVLQVMIRRRGNNPRGALESRFYPAESAVPPDLGASRETLPRAVTSLYRAHLSEVNGNGKSKAVAR